MCSATGVQNDCLTISLGVMLPENSPVVGVVHPELEEKGLMSNTLPCELFILLVLLSQIYQV